MSADEPTPPGPRMPCPDCGAVLELDRAALFAGTPVPCPGCGLQLQLEVKSQRGALRQLQAAQQKLAALKQAMTDGS